MSILINTANALVNGKPQLESMLIGFANKSIPLDERWEAYSILVKGKVLVNEENYGDGFIGMLVSATSPGMEYSMYDDFYTERHESKTFLDILEQIEEWGDGYNTELVPTAESLIAWKEHVLASGYSGFTYDW
jgi:hypothetical protein